MKFKIFRIPDFDQKIIRMMPTLPIYSSTFGQMGMGTDARADFDIFSQGGWRVSHGGRKFLAANAAQSATQRGTLLTSSNHRLSDILEINFFDLFRYIFCKGTNKTTKKQLFKYGGGGGGFTLIIL